MMERSPVQDVFEQAASDALARSAVVDGAARPGAATGTQVGATTQIEMLPYVLAESDGPGVEIVGMYGPVELEYAAIRQRTAVVDRPQIGTVIVRGGERLDLLNRLLTQEVVSMGAGEVRQSFLIQRQGRIEADLLLVETGEELVIGVDRHQAARVVEVLEGFVFAEDVQIVDESAQTHQIALHGPKALDMLAAVLGDDAVEIGVGGGGVIDVDGCRVTVARVDETGEVGLILVMPRDDAARVCTRLLGEPGAQPVGWFAWNMARIEAGTPVMNIDFGTNHLPHEAGVLDSRVSFKKGCYPGQEIVARMESRGGAKQRLIGLDVEGDVLPGSGDQVFLSDGDALGDAVGVVTSSTLSPMLSARPIGIAMMKKKGLDDGLKLVVHAEGQRVTVRVRDALRALGGGGHG